MAARLTLQRKDLRDGTRVWRLRDQGGPGCVLTAELAPEFDDAALDGLDIEVTQTAVHRTSRDDTGRWQRFGPMPGVCIRGGGFGSDGLTFIDPADGAVRRSVDFGDLLRDSGGGTPFVNLIDDSPSHKTTYVSSLFGSASEECKGSQLEFGLWRISGFENLEGA